MARLKHISADRAGIFDEVRRVLTFVKPDRWNHKDCLSHRTLNRNYWKGDGPPNTTKPNSHREIASNEIRTGATKNCLLPAKGLEVKRRLQNYSLL